MRVFITGPTASGKSTLARRRAAESGMPYIEYDVDFFPAPTSDNYCWIEHANMTPTGAASFINKQPHSFVMDNAVFDPTLNTFNALRKPQDIVQCIVPDKNDWMSRTTANGDSVNEDKWRYFWLNILPNIHQPYEFVDNDGNVLQRDVATEMIGLHQIISDHMEFSDYDHRYQAIPELGHIGYSESADSWDVIRPLVMWEHASVVDCGSFHGYFLFRIGDAGCRHRRIGLDFLQPALVTSAAVNALRGDTVEFYRWEAGQEVPYADVTLCLNALHHFPDNSHPLGTHCDSTCSVDQFFDTLSSHVVIFEAYTTYEDKIRSRWDRVEVHPSVRTGRAVYKCEAKNGRP